MRPQSRCEIHPRGVPRAVTSITGHAPSGGQLSEKPEPNRVYKCFRAGADLDCAGTARSAASQRPGTVRVACWCSAPGLSHSPGLTRWQCSMDKGGLLQNEPRDGSHEVLRVPCQLRALQFLEGVANSLTLVT